MLQCDNQLWLLEQREPAKCEQEATLNGKVTCWVGYKWMRKENRQKENKSAQMSVTPNGMTSVLQGKRPALKKKGPDQGSMDP